MKKSRKSLMLLPLLAICLSGCYEIIPEDAPEEIEDEFTPEGSYTLPEEDTSESSSIPYESTSGTESTGGDNTSTPSETPGGNTSSPSESTGEDSSSDSGKPSEPDDPTNPSESSGSSSSTPSETHEYSYSLQITNKDNFTNIYIDEDNPENNTYIEDYSLQINLYTLTDDVITNTEVASINDVSITSSDESVVALDGLTLIPQKKTGSATISVYWLDHSEAVDAFTCAVTYKAHQIVTSYEYELVINNKETLLNESWTTADSPREVDVSVLKSTLKDGELDSIDELENPNVRLTQENLTEGETNEILLIDGLSVTPKNPGSVRLTASWIEGDNYAEDYFDIIVSEAYYEGDYNLTITDPEVFGGTDTNPWYIGTSRELDVTLSYSDYAYSDDNLYNTYEIKATIDDVTISVYGVTDNEVVARADDDLTWYSQNGEIMLSPVAASYDHYLVVVAWNIHPEATDYVYVHTEMPETTYAMTITNAEEIGATWKYDDSKTRTLKYEITQTTQGVTTPTDKDTYKDGILAWTYPSGYVSVTDNGDGETITLELLKEPIDDVTVTVYVMWSEHTSAIGYVELDLYQYTYSISITNAEYLSAAWSLEDNETRDVTYQVTRDNTTLTELGSSYVEITSSDTGLASVDGTKVSAISVGNPTISATLYNEDDVVLATNTVLLSIDDVVKATSVTLSNDYITFESPDETTTLSAAVYGLNDREATDQSVTWASNNDSITITGSGNEVTIGVTDYSVEGTVTCTTLNGVASATCYVYIGAQAKLEGSPVPVHNPGFEPVSVSSPDDNGVYVLGTLESENRYLVSDTGFSTTTTYNEASAVRVEQVEDGYYLQIGEQYVVNSSGTFKLENEGSLLTIEEDGLIKDESYVLGLASSGLEWSSSIDNPLYLLDIVSADHTFEVTGGSETYYFAASDNGTLKYWTGSVSSYHGGLTEDVNDAAKVSIDPVDGTNAYYIMYGSNCLYGQEQTSGNSTNHNVYSNSTLTPSYYISDGDYWKASDSDRFFGLSGSDDMRTYATSNLGSYPAFRLYSTETSSEDIEVKGISLTLNEYTYTHDLVLNPKLQVYPTYVNDTLTIDDLTFTQESISGGSVTINGSTITTNSNAGDVKITGTAPNGVSDSFIITIEEGEHVASEALLGTFDFSKDTSSSTTAFTTTTAATYLNDCWDGDGVSSSPLSSVTETAYTYNGGGSGTAGNINNSKAAMKLSSSSYEGYITLNFGDYDISKIVVKACGYNGNSSSYTLTVSGASGSGTYSSSQQMSQSGASLTYNTSASADDSDSESSVIATITDYTYDFGVDSTLNTIKFNANGKNRILIFSIQVYGMI